MQRVLVVDTNKNPLMPCHPARARQLLRAGKASVLRHQPFTLVLKERMGGEVQEVDAKVDPGSHTSGIALVADFQRGKRVIWAGEIEHRGEVIKARLLTRRQLRRGRRHRKTRYRKPRFENRKRQAGWLPPSLQSRVENISTWIGRLERFAPLVGLSLELVKFDTQQLQDPEISGVEYQQGELQGYEIREYLLEKWGRACVYCGATGVLLEVEHITPRSRGGSHRVSNLAIACTTCNLEKGSQTAEEYGFPHIQAKAKKPLKDAAAVNSTRWHLYHALLETGLPLEVGSGGRTKYNRFRQAYPKAHWIDAACVGESGETVFIHPAHQPLHIKATGHGSRQMCRMDRFGFPRTQPKQARRVHGFQTGDRVKAIVLSGKNQGTHVGRAAVRTKGSFRVGQVDGISWRYCRLIQHADGYTYQKGGGASSPR